MPERKRRAKTSVETSVTVKLLVDQPHGGALLPGGTGAGGRPKEVLRQAMREAFNDKRGVEFLAGVMAGEIGEKVAVTTGVGKHARTKVVTLPAKIRDRLYAAELLMDRGYGKPDQALSVKEKMRRPTGEETRRRIMELLPRVLPMLPVDRKEVARLFLEQRDIELLVSGEQVKDLRSGNGDAAGT